MLLVEWQPTLLGAAAIISAIGGLITTIIGTRRRGREEKDKADEQCRQRLRDTRAEAEKLAEALHRYRMDELSDKPQLRDQRPEEIDDILDRWSHLE